MKILSKDQIVIAELETVIATAMRVKGVLHTAGIYRNAEGTLILVYKGDRLTANTQIKIALFESRETARYSAEYDTLNRLLAEHTANPDKLPKVLVVECYKHQSDKTYANVFFSIQSAVSYYAHSLDCGRSYQHEKGRKKINPAPTTLKSLISNLNNAVDNSAANGYAGITYTGFN